MSVDLQCRECHRPTVAVDDRSAETTGSRRPHIGADYFELVGELGRVLRNVNLMVSWHREWNQLWPSEDEDVESFAG